MTHACSSSFGGGGGVLKFRMRLHWQRRSLGEGEGEGDRAGWCERGGLSKSVKLNARRREVLPVRAAGPHAKGLSEMK